MKKLLFLVLFTGFAVVVHAQLTVGLMSLNQISCHNGCDGSVTAAATGGTPPYNYVWMPGNINSPSLTNACAGQYTCTVTDALSATASVVATFGNPSLLTVSASGIPTCGSGCTGQLTALGSGGTAAYTYSWSPTVMNTSAVCAGSYTVTVTDANGCTATNTATVASNPNPTVAVTPSSPSICSGSTVNITASGATTYAWVPGNITGASVTLSPTITTTYTVSGTSPTGCVSTTTFLITVSQPSVGGTAAGSTSVCGPVNNGVVTLSGHTGAVVRWEMSTDGGVTWMNIANPTTSQSFTNLSVTTIYRARVQSGICAHAYSSWATITVTPGPSLTTSGQWPTCNNADGIANVVATGNAPFTYNWLPTGGNLSTATGLVAGAYQVDVMDINGCVSSATVTLQDSCDYVWPGDANDDGVADNIDVLDIGIANGATGTTRANATTAWVGQPSTAWGQTLLSGTDYKWVDCDGNGAINPIDTQAVTLNYGYTHNNRMQGPVYTLAAPALMISFDQDSLAAGSTGTMTLSFGDATDPANNVYGLAFRLNFDAAQISTASFGMTGGTTWLGTPGTDLMRVTLHPSPSNGFVDVAITRLDQQNVSGSGTIGQVYYTATTALNGSGNAVQVPMTITNLVVVNAAGQQQPANVINDTVVIADSAIITSVPAPPTEVFSVYPNPANENLQITINSNHNELVTLEDISGRVVYSQMHTPGASSISVASLPAGTYLMRITNGTSAHVERITITH